MYVFINHKIKIALLLVFVFCSTANAAYTVRSGHPRLYINSTNVASVKQRIVDHNQAQFIDNMTGSYGLDTFYGSDLDTLYPGVGGQAQRIDTQTRYAAKSGIIRTLNIDDTDIAGYSYAHTISEYAIEGVRYLVEWAAEDNSTSLDVNIEYIITGYDHLYDLLTPTQRQAIVDKLVVSAEWCINNDSAKTRSPFSSKAPGLHRWTIIGLAFYGDGYNDAKAIEYCNDYETYTIGNLLPSFNFQQGSWFAGPDYTKSYFNRFAYIMGAWETATTDSINFYTTYNDFFTGVAEALLHDIAPNPKQEWIKHSDIRLFGVSTPFPFASDIAQDPMLSRGLGVICDYIRTKAEENTDTTTASECSYLVNSFGWQNYNDIFLLIWGNTDATQLDLSTFSTFYKNENVGIVSSRTSFDLDDNQTIDATATQLYFNSKPWYYANHDNPMANSLMIMRENPLMIRGGAYQSGDKDEHEANFYYLKSGAQVYIYDPDETFYFGGAQQPTASNTGGCRWFQADPFLADFTDGSNYDFGDGITRSFDNSNIFYTQGDASSAFTDKCTLNIRDITWDKSTGIAVIFDRITESAVNQAKEAGSNKKYWITRSETTPTIDGSTVTVDSDGGSSRIIYKTVLPVNHSISYVSGFKDLEDTEFTPNFTYYANDTSYGVGDIRVTPTSTDVGTHNEFLHLIKVGANTITMPDTDSISGTGWKGVHVKDTTEIISTFSDNVLGADALATVSYTITTTNNSRHIISGLTKNTEYTVTGGSAVNANSGEAGVIEFTSVAGTSVEYIIRNAIPSGGVTIMSLTGPVTSMSLTGPVTTMQ